MNINSWKEIVGFKEIGKYPLLPCPYCQQAQLEIDNNSLQKRKITTEAAVKFNRKYKSEKERVSEEYENRNGGLEIKEGGGFLGVVFSLLETGYAMSSYFNNPINGIPHQVVGYFQCRQCKESVAATGLYMESDKAEGNISPSVIKIDNFSPTIPIVSVSVHVPLNIKNELYDAFKHFHFDPPSSASKLRRAIEQFCEDWQAKGKNLHQKICSLKEKHPEEAEYLESLKLIGNEGTHASDVSEIDLLHSFEIFQFVLELYDRKERYLKTQKNYQQLVKKFGSDKLQLSLEHKKEEPEPVS